MLPIWLTFVLLAIALGAAVLALCIWAAPTVAEPVLGFLDQLDGVGGAPIPPPSGLRVTRRGWCVLIISVLVFMVAFGLATRGWVWVRVPA